MYLKSKRSVLCNWRPHFDISVAYCVSFQSKFPSTVFMFCVFYMCSQPHEATQGLAPAAALLHWQGCGCCLVVKTMGGARLPYSTTGSTLSGDLLLPIFAKGLWALALCPLPHPTRNSTLFLFTAHNLHSWFYKNYYKYIYFTIKNVAIIPS